MKRTIYLLVISLYLLIPCLAQSQIQPKVIFGVKGGINLSNFSTGNELSSSARVGYQAGVWSRIAIGTLHFQPELYYTEKKARLNESVLHNMNDVNLKRIDLPLLLGYAWGGDQVTGRIQTGPVFSFANGDKQTAATIYNSTFIGTGNYNYGWLLGVGTDVGRISFDLRYEAGLKTIPNIQLDSKLKANLISFSLAYRLFSLYHE